MNTPKSAKIIEGYCLVFFSMHESSGTDDISGFYIYSARPNCSYFLSLPRSSTPLLFHSIKYNKNILTLVLGLFTEPNLLGSIIKIYHLKPTLLQ